MTATTTRTPAAGTPVFAYHGNKVHEANGKGSTTCGAGELSMTLLAGNLDIDCKKCLREIAKRGK